MREIAGDAERLPDREEVRHALERVLASEGFVGSPRLQAFLAYIVEQELDGLGDAIKGKIIATDVYRKVLDENGGALNLVSVEARRLRRALDDYYADAGRSDPMRITMQSGGYRPQFESNAPATPLVDDSQQGSHFHIGVQQHKLAFLIGAVSLASVLVVGYFSLQSAPPNAVVAASNSSAKLAALREGSLASVQAVNLAEQTRGMFFPLFDTKRQTINLETFQHVIDLDPNLSAGYAGSAQVLALQSMIATDPAEAAALAKDALKMAERATTLDPTDGWSQAAHGWTLVVAGDMEAGLRRARIAAELEPQDGNVLDLIGISALLANEPSLMAEVSHPDRIRVGSGRFAYNNIYGASQLMLQNYDEVIDAFSTAAERGHPVSAPSLFLLATAYQENGDTSRAQQAIEEMWATWPGFPASEIVARFFENDPVTRSRVLAVLDANMPD